jgi:hypothetical protein
MAAKKKKHVGLLNDIIIMGHQYVGLIYPFGQLRLRGYGLESPRFRLD